MTEAQQKKYIAKHYLKLPQKVMAANIGRSNTFVRTELRRSGLVIPAKTIMKFRRLSQFSKGYVSANKGMKQSDYMSPEAIETTKATRFQKGNLPHNTKDDMAITLRQRTGKRTHEKYYWIRVGLAKWDLLHRYLWVIAYGSIPKGHNVQFKDGNSLNCKPDNLYLVTRSDQATHNKMGGAKIPHELLETITLINKLKKSANEKQNH